jgi:uncharacterized protein YjbI with pentapeptide repeats
MLLGCGVLAYAQEPSSNRAESNMTSQPATAPSPRPTPDPIPASLQREKFDLDLKKLDLEVRKLQVDTENSERDLSSRRGWINLIFTNVTIITALVLGFWGLYRYLRERHEELRKREDERFEGIVKSLGSQYEQERISAAVLLPTFLRPGYERFYNQVFNLAAGNLRVGSQERHKEDPSDTKDARPPEINAPLKLALTNVLREAYPLARREVLMRRDGAPQQGKLSISGLTFDGLPSIFDLPISLVNSVFKKYGIGNKRRNIKREKGPDTARYLNGSGLKLDGAYLDGASFRNAWLRDASLVGVSLKSANLFGSVLENSNMTSASLEQTDLRKANLRGVNFTKANLTGAFLSGARADSAIFRDSVLKNVMMVDGIAAGTDFSGADLSNVKFENVDFTATGDNKKTANPEDAKNLTGALFINVIGLSEAQKKICEVKGATIQEMSKA